MELLKSYSQSSSILVKKHQSREGNVSVITPPEHSGTLNCKNSSAVFLSMHLQALNWKFRASGFGIEPPVVPDAPTALRDAPGQGVGHLGGPGLRLLGLYLGLIEFLFRAYLGPGFRAL